jgi:Phosphatidylinositol-specific phospholipase C, Y domain
VGLYEHNRKYLTRVYPFGLRFSSSNQEPAMFWRTGAQLVALNWQRFDLGMQQNFALFGGGGGMVLKPTKTPDVTLTIDVPPTPLHFQEIN